MRRRKIPIGTLVFYQTISDLFHNQKKSYSRVGVIIDYPEENSDKEPYAILLTDEGKMTVPVRRCKAIQRLYSKVKEAI